jgi:opacity protein-like surface antigen
MNLGLSGVTGGGQLGYNWQFNNIVVGAEGEFDGWDLHRTGTNSMPFTAFPVPAGGIAPLYTNTVSSTWWASVRGRVGWTPNPSLLLYATGGVAFSDWKYTHTFNIGTFPGSVPGGEIASSTKTLVAPAVGGGFEVMLTPSWGLKADYLYMPFGSISLRPTPVVVFPGPTPLGQFFRSKATNLDANVIRVGINYHFGAPPPPPAPAAMPAPPPAAPKVFIVFFDWDRDTITNEGRQIIAQAADAYRSGAPVQIQVTGYTDRSGSAGYNQRLSERRANNVAKALAALGVPPAQMVVSGRGENDNRVPTANGVREPQNRRVEIVTP